MEMGRPFNVLDVIKFLGEIIIGSVMKNVIKEDPGNDRMVVEGLSTSQCPR